MKISPPRFWRAFLLAALLTLAGLIPAQAAEVIILPSGQITAMLSADQVNQELINQGRATPQTLPFTPGSQVTELRTLARGYYVRYYTYDASRLKGGAVGSWAMPGFSVNGQSAAQVRDIFALPSLPDHVTLVRMPAVTLLRIGEAGPITGWGEGGGEQILLMDRIAVADYTLQRDLPGQVYGGPFAAKAGKGNAGAMAAYLDRQAPASFSYLEVTELMLQYLSDGQRREALNRLGPERYDALTQLGLRDAQIFLDTLRQRRREPAWTSPSAAPGQAAPFRQDLGGHVLWGRGFGSVGDYKATDENLGFKYAAGGFAGGVDFLLAPDLLWGLGMMVSRANFDWKDDNGGGDLDNLKLGAHLSYFRESLFADAALTAGYQKADLARRVSFPGVWQEATSSPKGYNLAAGVSGGLNYKADGWLWQPTAGLAMFYVSYDSFAETGAEDLNLKVDGFDVLNLRGELAVQVSRAVTLEGGFTFLPRLRAGWARHLGLKGQEISACLNGQPGGFTVDGRDGDYDAAAFGLELALQAKDGGAFYLRYDAEIADDSASHVFFAGGRIPF